MEPGCIAAFGGIFKEFNRPFLKGQTPSVHLQSSTSNSIAQVSLLGMGYRFCNSFVQFMDMTLPYAGKPQGKLNQYYGFKTDMYTECIVNNAIAVCGKNKVKGENIA